MGAVRIAFGWRSWPRYVGADAGKQQLDGRRGGGVTTMAKTPETARETDAKGPSMSRSQAQIAMSYAPGQHFTFEGAAGACQAMPSPNATRRG